MYGKIFQRMYQGSMVGAGSHVFSVWGYCIANADPESHTVDLNPVLLSTIIGESVERIEAAIEFLCSPDPNSHNDEHEGRRLLNTGGFEYFLVSHKIYRDLTNKEDLRAYFREAKRKQRSMSKTVKDNIGQSQDSASVSSSVSSSEGDSLKGDEKKAYGEFGSVKLKDAEYEKLKTKQGEARLLKGIEILDDYMRSKGKRYKDHYAVLKETSWVWERLDQHGKNTVKTYHSV